MSAAYNIKCTSIRLDIIMEANTMDPDQTAPLWEQSDLGPYCLQYKLEHKQMNEQMTKVRTGRNRVKKTKPCFSNKIAM